MTDENEHSLHLLHSLFQATFFFFYAFWSVYLNLYSTDYLELTSFGMIVCKSSIIVVNVKLLLVSRHWDPLFVSSVALSLAAFFLVSLGYSAVRVSPAFASFLYGGEDFDDGDLDSVPASFETFWVALHAFSSWGLWMLSVLVLVACLLPDLALQVAVHTNIILVQLILYIRLGSAHTKVAMTL